jgi:hypothetical protein
MNNFEPRQQRSTRTSKKQFDIKNYIAWLKSTFNKKSSHARTSRLDRVLDRKNGPLNPERRNEFAKRTAQEVRTHMQYLYESLGRATRGHKRGVSAC